MFLRKSGTCTVLLILHSHRSECGYSTGRWVHAHTQKSARVRHTRVYNEYTDIQYAHP